MANYTFSSLSQTFNFGKFSGLTLNEVMVNNPSYITWCIDNISDFCMTPDLINHIKSKFSDFVFDEEFVNRFNNLNADDDMDSFDVDYGSHYGEFEGSYAQDVMGYSDDVINDAFEGDPDCYWNID